MKVWICVGTPENWEIALSGNVWGVKERLQSLWKTLQKEDLLLFYATSPIKGIIGVGVVKNKFKQDKPLWPEEIKENKAIWPYRYEFKTEFVLPRSDWETKKIDISKLKLVTKAGLNPVENKQKIEQIFQEMDKLWNTELIKLIEESPQKLSQKEVNTHKEIKKKLLELGKIEGYIAEEEYHFPDIDERLDVVWRRVIASVPTYAFEVHIEGNIHQALSKLKHAYDIWNSNIFIVTTQQNVQKIEKLLSGSFHDIKEVIRILTIEKVNEVYELQVRDQKLKKELGLR